MHLHGYRSFRTINTLSYSRQLYSTQSSTPMGLAERIRSRVAQVGRMKAMSYTVGTSAAVSFLWLFWGAQNPPSWVHDLKLYASIMTSLVLLRTSGADDPKTVREYSVLKYMQSLAESSPQGRKVLITSGLWKSALNSIKDNRYQIHDKIRKIVSTGMMNCFNSASPIISWTCFSDTG